MPTTLVNGGPNANPENVVYDLECEECSKRVRGSPDPLVDDGWHWADVQVEDGRQIGFALCPDHANDDLIAVHGDVLRDRINKQSISGGEQQTL